VDLGFHIGPTHRYVLLEREVGSTRRQEIGSVPTDRLAYVHSFGLTDRYAAIVESPPELRVRRLFQDRPFIKRFAWDEARNTRVLIVDRESGRLVADPETAPFMTYHHVNAFERGDTLIVDLVAYDDDYAVEGLSLDRTRSDTDDFPVGRLRRFEIELAATVPSAPMLTVLTDRDPPLLDIDHEQLFATVLAPPPSMDIDAAVDDDRDVVPGLDEACRRLAGLARGQVEPPVEPSIADPRNDSDGP
jgi:hypothetical protein